MPTEVRNNERLRRYEMAIGDAVAFVAYERDGERIVFTHTEIPRAYAGSDTGAALVCAALDAARREHLKIVPRCPFVASILRHHAAYQDLMTAGER
ncbi:MAG: N-acetyltransferase [Acetobacteraceae bacterium]|nr:N-acetyltransferase [Acetobacteraceae bacterium]